MATKVKVTVSVEESLIRDLAKASRKTGRPRSQLVEEALRLWRHSQIEQALKEGYRAMAKEDRETAERRLGAGTSSEEGFTPIPNPPPRRDCGGEAAARNGPSPQWASDCALRPIHPWGDW